LLATIAKPLIRLATGWQGVLGGRFLDRLGSGIRSAPRDGLIAASADEGHRGKAFGLEGIGDNLGAFLGPILAVVILYTFHIPIRYVFYLAFIPGLLAFILILFVKEASVLQKKKESKFSGTIKYPYSYWKYIGAIGLFGLGNVSNSFLILQTKNIGVPLEGTIIIYAFYNLVAALISYPSGFLSDTFGRKNILLSSFVIFLFTYLFFAFTKNIVIIAVLFILYGLYQGIFRSVGKAYASDFVPQEMRASSIGWYSTVVGLSGLIANLIAGQLWDRVSHESVFLYGACLGIISIIYLVFFVKEHKAIPVHGTLQV
jgi:MFS family permease